MPDGLYADVIAKHGFVPANHESPQWFPVSAGDVFDAQGRPIAGYQRIARDDTGDTIALHTNDYKLVPYERNFAAFEREIAQSGLDTRDMQVATDMTHNGGRVFRQYLFPALTREIVHGDSLALRIIMFDSYDGSYAFRGLAGHFRFVCANTAVLGDAIIEIKAEHVANFGARAEGMIKQIVATAESFESEAHRMRNWSNTPLLLTQAREIISHLPQAPESLQDRLFSEYSVQHGERGTAWDLYNVLTSWATHVERGKHAAQTKAQREQRVAQLTERKPWMEMVG